VAQRLLAEELPFLATETILMQAVLRGGDRQSLHEALREHSLAAAREMKEEARDNTLLEKLAADGRFPFRLDELRDIAYGSDFTGLASAQVEEFLNQEVTPLLQRYAHLGEPETQVRV
jgi:adenylosuccinate lyase